MGEGELKCLRRAAIQYGLLRRSDVLQHVTEDQLHRRLKTRKWAEVVPGVYRVEGAPLDWRAHLKAIAWWLGRDYAFSHETAAALRGFDRFKEGPLVVSVTRRVNAKAPIVVREVKQLAASDLESLDGMRVTNPTRTLLDLSGTVRHDADLRAAVDQALRCKWTTVERLEQALERTIRRPGLCRLRPYVHQLAGGDGPSESELEALVYELLEGSGLPRPVRQRVVKVGHRLRRLDFCFPEWRVIIEADGYAWHSTPKAFEADRRRRNSLVARGFIVLNWTWTALQERPGELIAELASVLTSR
jgi:very-short-patch-repair endonuclease